MGSTGISGNANYLCPPFAALINQQPVKKCMHYKLIMHSLLNTLSRLLNSDLVFLLKVLVSFLHFQFDLYLTRLGDGLSSF